MVKKNKKKSETKKVVVPNATMQTPPHRRHLVEVQVFKAKWTIGTTAEWKLVKSRARGWNFFQDNGIREMF